MIKTKEINFSEPAMPNHLSIDYESEDGTIVAICIDDVDILPILNESVLNRIIDVFNGSFSDD